MKNKILQKLIEISFLFSVFFILFSLVLGGRPWKFPRGILFALQTISQPLPFVVKKNKGKADQRTPALPSQNTSLSKIKNRN